MRRPEVVGLARRVAPDGTLLMVVEVVLSCGHVIIGTPVDHPFDSARFAGGPCWGCAEIVP